MTARQVMRREPRSISPDDSLARAAELMALLGTREIPIVAARVVVGVLTRADMEPYRGHYEWTPARAAMTRDPVTVRPDASVYTVARLLSERGFNSVPVAHNGELVGMISRSDVLRALAGTS